MGIYYERKKNTAVNRKRIIKKSCIKMKNKTVVILVNKL